MKLIGNIAINTWKEFVRDRIFYINIVGAFFILGFSYLLSSLTIVESRKIMLDFAFAAASLCGVASAIFLGVVAMAREIENRTIYTILSKPVSRSFYILGKYLGSALVLFVIHLVFSLTILFILFLSGEKSPAGFASCMFMIYLENVLLLAVAFFFSSVTSSLLSTGITVSVFLIGRSTYGLPQIIQKDVGEAVKFLLQGAYYLFPNLERFNLRDVVAYNKPFPEEMVWWGLVYCLLYVVLAISACGLVFQKRDLP